MPVFENISLSLLERAVFSIFAISAAAIVAIMAWVAIIWKMA
jgi:hypothetical protein